MNNLSYEDNLEYEDNLKYEDSLKYEDYLKYEDNLKHEDSLKYDRWHIIRIQPQIQSVPWLWSQPQIDQTKLNLPSQTCQTKPVIPKLSNQIYHTKPNQTHQSIKIEIMNEIGISKSG